MSSAASIRFLSLAFAGFVVVGCDWPPSGSGTSSSSGTTTSSTPAVTPASSPPVLEAANMTASASAENGEYDIFGSLTFECDGCGTTDVVHTVQIYVPVLGKTYSYPGGDVTSAYGASFGFSLSSDIPLTSAGPTNYEITLVTLGGVKSTPLLETVDLL